MAAGSTGRRRRPIPDRGTETHKDDSRQRTDARLGSLAVKRVLGKDESPGSNPGLGLHSQVQSFYRLVKRTERGEIRSLTRIDAG